eukprot:755099-Hanusia_phi.AAC.2
MFRGATGLACRKDQPPMLERSTEERESWRRLRGAEREVGRSGCLVKQEGRGAGAERSGRWEAGRQGGQDAWSRWRGEERETYAGEVKEAWF